MRWAVLWLAVPLAACQPAPPLADVAFYTGVASLSSNGTAALFIDGRRATPSRETLIAGSWTAVGDGAMRLYLQAVAGAQFDLVAVFPNGAPGRVAGAPFEMTRIDSGMQALRGPVAVTLDRITPDGPDGAPQLSGRFEGQACRGGQTRCVMVEGRFAFDVPPSGA